MMFGQLSNRESLRDLIVAFEAHRVKQYHLGLGRKPIAKTTFASANQNRDYRIFEDFAFYMMEQASKKRVTDIFKLKGNVYAFDSTTIPLCLSVFWWAKFRKKKGGVKAHVLYDLESQVPAFFHISTASVYDSKVMKDSKSEGGTVLNLNLKDKAKGRWSGNAKIGGGVPNLWEEELFAAKLSSTNQTAITLKTNNSGKDILGENKTLTLDDLLSQEAMDEPKNILEISQEKPASLDDKRTRKARTHLVNISNVA